MLAGVAENVNDKPLLGVTEVVPPLTVKSVANPVVAPLLPLTVIVHVAVFVRRNGLGMVHTKLDAVVGVPYTANEGEPDVRAVPPVFAVIV